MRSNKTARQIAGMAMLAGALSVMAGCGDPPQTTSTSYEQTTTTTTPSMAPAAMPGTVTTNTTHTQTVP